MEKVYRLWVLISGAIGLSEARILTASPLASSAQPLSVIFQFWDMFKLVKCLLTCKKSIEKAWLAGGANRGQNAWKTMCKPAAKWGQNASRVCMCRRRQHVGGVYEDGESNKNQR